MKNLTSLILICLVLTACSKDEVDGIGGSESVIGEPGNFFTISSNPALSNVSATVSGREDGISTITFSAELSDTMALHMVDEVDGVSSSGNTVQSERQYRISSKGMQSVYADGDLTLVKYDANVGDVYTLKRGMRTIRREVTAKSTEDDFLWNGLLIKVIKVRETGRNIPGLAALEMAFNHKFGIVYADVQFEDGSSEEVYIVSDKN